MSQISKIEQIIQTQNINIKNELTKLIDEDINNLIHIIRLAKKYYYQGNPFIDDNIYDLYETLYESTFGKLPEVGEEIDETKVLYKKTNHNIPMGSLNKVNSIDELIKWMKTKKIDEKNKFCIQPKLDGCSISLEYQNNKLKDVITRGDGKVGESVMSNSKKIKAILPTINLDDVNVDVRGELIMSKDNFLKLMDENPELTFKNARNAVAGIIRRKDKKYTEYLTFIAYDIEKDNNLSQESQKIDILKQQGFETPKYWLEDISEIMKRYKNIKDFMNEYEYETDGLVIKTNDTDKNKLKDDLRPEYSIAIKPPNTFKITYLRDIEWSISDNGTGIVTPVAIFDPVEIDGGTLTRASLANFTLLEEWIKKGLSIGAKIEVSRNNMVIPQVANVLEIGNKEIEIINTCPDCGSILNRNGVKKQCMNSNCLSIKIGTILSFIDKLKILGISKETIKKLYNNNIVKSPLDLFKIKDFKNEIVYLPGFGIESFNNIVKAIPNDFSIKQYLAAMNIEGWSEKQLDKIIDLIEYQNEQFIIDKDKLIKTKGFEVKSYDKLMNGFEKNKDMINEIFKIEPSLINDFDLNTKKILKNENSNKIGIKVCFTGNLDNNSEFKNRKEFEKYCIEKGVIFNDSVSTDLTYLICNDLTSTSSKMTKAQKYNISVISEKEFILKLNELPKIETTKSCSCTVESENYLYMTK